jgi:initiation factor 1A
MYQTSIRNKKKHQSFNRNKEKYKLNEEEEEYAYVINMLGNCRVLLISNTGINCTGVISGNLRKFNKRVLIEKGDIVIITKSNTIDKKVYILHKLNSEQVNDLISVNGISNILISKYNCISNNNDDCIDTLTENLNFIDI